MVRLKHCSPSTIPTKLGRTRAIFTWTMGKDFTMSLYKAGRDLPKKDSQQSLLQKVLLPSTDPLRGWILLQPVNFDLYMVFTGIPDMWPPSTITVFCLISSVINFKKVPLKKLFLHNLKFIETWHLWLGVNTLAGNCTCIFTPIFFTGQPDQTLRTFASPWVLLITGLGSIK